jgi:tetratricopeptide (TPR) repeat protein
MVKQKRGPKFTPNKAGPKALSVFEQGFDLFSKGKFFQAISAWEKLPGDHPERANALGEAYFRRYLADQAESDLDAARRWLPQDPRLMYQLGLLRHRQGRLEEALEAYRQAIGAGLSTRRAQTVRALAEIEHNPHNAAQALAPLSEVDRVRLLPAAYLLKNEPQALIDWQLPDLRDAQEKLLKQEPALQRLWQGLAEFSTQQFERAAESLAPLTRGQPLPADANSVRMYYHALALAHSGQEAQGLAVLEHAVQRAHFPAMSEALVTLVLRQVSLPVQGDGDDPIPLLERALKVAPTESRLAAVYLTHLANRAEQAARGNAWRAALADWLRMEGLIRIAPEYETTGSIVHNLAIAYERLEDWENAALRWNEVINLLPRRPSSHPSKRFSPEARLAHMPVSEAKDWLRKRVILCYQKAGQPERAVDMYRKAVKQDPGDLPLRMGLVDALIANEQWQAAENELGRIIELGSRYVNRGVADRPNQ